MILTPVRHRAIIVGHTSDFIVVLRVVRLFQNALQSKIRPDWSRNWKKSFHSRIGSHRQSTPLDLAGRILYNCAFFPLKCGVCFVVYFPCNEACTNDRLYTLLKCCNNPTVSGYICPKRREKGNRWNKNRLLPAVIYSCGHNYDTTTIRPRHEATTTTLRQRINMFFVRCNLGRNEGDSDWEINEVVVRITPSVPTSVSHQVIWITITKLMIMTAVIN